MVLYLFSLIYWLKNSINKFATEFMILLQKCVCDDHTRIEILSKGKLSAIFIFYRIFISCFTQKEYKIDPPNNNMNDSQILTLI